nr:MAG: RNA-dependent RNA polymerase [Riboviria sp.]
MALHKKHVRKLANMNQQPVQNQRGLGPRRVPGARRQQQPPAPGAAGVMPGLHQAIYQAGVDSIQGLLDPLFDPTDQVVRGYPPLHDHGCIAIPNRACYGSALRLAHALVMRDQGADEPLLGSDGILSAPDCAKMRRHLNRVGCNSFPIYVLYRNPTAQIRGNEFVLFSGQHRSDNWAVLFVPPDPQYNFYPGHWTFTQIDSSEASPEVAIVPPQADPAVIYTRAPVVDPIVYWRCIPTPENIEFYVKKQAAGTACNCCWMINPCPHQTLYMIANPGARVVTLVNGMLIEDGFRACIVDVVEPGWALDFGPDRHVDIHSPGETVWHARDAYDNMTIKNSSLYSPPWPFTLFSRNSTLHERFWPFQNNIFEPPVEIRDMVVRPYAFRCYRYANRLPYPGTSLGAGCALACGLISLAFRRSGKWGIAFVFGLSSLYIGVKTSIQVLLRHFASTFPRFVTSVPTTRPYGWHPPTITLPCEQELNSRLACRDQVTREMAVDVYRRLANQEKWGHVVHKQGFQAWLTNVITAVGETPSIPVLRSCYTCRAAKTRCKHHECKTCRARRRHLMPEKLVVGDYLVRHEGFRGLWSKEFLLPNFEFKPDARIGHRCGKTLTTAKQLLRWLEEQPVELSCRGRSCGPIFMGQEPTCFPRGVRTALAAFGVRLAAERKHGTTRRFYDLLFQFLVVTFGLEEIQPEDWQLFLGHFRGDKRKKMEEARVQRNEGWRREPEQGKLRVTMKGFTKAEKSYSFEYDIAGHLEEKRTEKPRFICSPDPILLSELGPYTHAQTKWLAKKFPHTSHLYYAGCSTPTELNEWLNWTIREIPEPVSLADDITAIDANHSQWSFRFHQLVREQQFRNLSDYISAAFEGEERLRVLVENWICTVGFVNASGVSDTSYKNSLLCLLLRILALAYACTDLPNFSEQLFPVAHAILPQVFVTASGDDGLVRMSAYLTLPDGTQVDTCHPRFRDRYMEFWALAGFEVKVKIYPPTEWRKATYLAARPVWGGQAYVWTPEPARRLRGLFWQIDSTMHPIAWARGVATQVLYQAACVPILSHVCEFVLERTKGPVAEVNVFDKHSPWYQNRNGSVRNDRATREFCIDYGLVLEDLKAFEALLNQTGSPLVSLYSFALDRVFQEE